MLKPRNYFHFHDCEFTEINKYYHDIRCQLEIRVRFFHFQKVCFYLLLNERGSIQEYLKKGTRKNESTDFLMSRMTWEGPFLRPLFQGQLKKTYTSPKKNGKGKEESIDDICIRNSTGNIVIRLVYYVIV